MTNKLPELAKACWIPPEYMTYDADGNPKYVYSDSIMAFYMGVRRDALLEAVEACRNEQVKERADQRDAVYNIACRDCAEALQELIEETWQ